MGLHYVWCELGSEQTCAPTGYQVFSMLVASSYGPPSLYLRCLVPGPQIHSAYIIPFIHWRWFLCCWFFIVLNFALEAWVNIGKWNIEDWDIVLDTAKGGFCIQEIQCDTCYYYRVNINTRYGYLSSVKNKDKEEKISWTLKKLNELIWIK